MNLLQACNQPQTSFETYENYPVAVDENLWTQYTPGSTEFKLWSPTAEAVRIKLYEKGSGDNQIDQHDLERNENGLWRLSIDGDLKGTYYTFQTLTEGEWNEETPGIYAQAVGVNGQRAMVVDLNTTDPDGWDKDDRVDIQKPNEAIIYELHIRDMTIHPSSGSSKPGKYLGLVEKGTKSPSGQKTGIDHMKELGITHVHLLPTYDHYSINEAKLDSPQFNWGYDPQNYNVPEGSFSSNPHDAAVRIREFKEMVKTFHDNGIGVILDVVYNHTGRTENSNFNLESPGYYYRHWEDGSYSDAAACGNETASERAMVRKFIMESVSYWATEYHLDGFRFDLMGIHDIETMNLIADTLKSIDERIFIYGEGWTAGDSPLPVDQRALKHHMQQLPQVSAFSDDIRDGLKGSVFDDESTGFVSGATDMEASVQFGVVGSTQHPQINYEAVNYSDDPWTNEPWQAISYVSCHDNHTLYDKLMISRPDADEEMLKAMHQLANGIVLTTQGIAFLHAGVDMLRTKDGEHNSYNLPDSINQIDWKMKKSNQEVFQFYKQMISLRKAHPAFSMPDAEMVRKHLSFIKAEDGVVSFVIRDNANGDDWKNIFVIYNANEESIAHPLEGNWTVAAHGNSINQKGIRKINKQIEIDPISMAILFQQ